MGLSDFVNNSVTLKESGMTTFIGVIYGKSYFLTLGYNEEIKLKALIFLIQSMVKQ